MDDQKQMLPGLGGASEQEPRQREPDMMEREDGEPASPEEQAIYDRVVKNALELIYPANEEGVAQSVMQSLSGSDNPVVNLAMTTASLVNGLVMSAQKAGQKIPGDVLLAAGAEVLEVLVEVAEAARIHEFSEEDMERGWYLAVDMYREQAKAAGTLDEEALKADFAMLEEAEKEGRIDEVLPGAREHAEKLAASQPQPEQLMEQEQA